MSMKRSFPGAIPYGQRRIPEYEPKYCEKCWDDKEKLTEVKFSNTVLCENCWVSNCRFVYIPRAMIGR